MFLISYAFAGEQKQFLGYATSDAVVNELFNELKEKFETDYNNPFTVKENNGLYSLTGNEHDGYRICYTAEPLLPITEVLR